MALMETCTRGAHDYFTPPQLATVGNRCHKMHSCLHLQRVCAACSPISACMLLCVYLYRLQDTLGCCSLPHLPLEPLALLGVCCVQLDSTQVRAPPGQGRKRRREAGRHTQPQTERAHVNKTEQKTSVHAACMQPVPGPYSLTFLTPARQPQHPVPCFPSSPPRLPSPPPPLTPPLPFPLCLPHLASSVIQLDMTDSGTTTRWGPGTFITHLR